MKSLDYYLNLPYKIEITPIPNKLGGGYMATLPEIGKYAITGDGDTIEEAVENLSIAKREQFEIYLKNGVKIPEPESEKQYSGKFPLRFPKDLHKDIATTAKAEGMSVNSYIIYLLSSANELAHTRNYVMEEIKECINLFTNEIKYTMNNYSSKTNKLYKFNSSDNYDMAA